MAAVPNALAGAVTLAALVGLGVFGYPWLLRRRGGRGWLALATAALSALYYGFDQPSDRPAISLLLAALWAAAPALTGLVVHRLQTPPATHQR